MVTKTSDGKFRASYLVDGNFVDAGVFDTAVEAETEADRARQNMLVRSISDRNNTISNDAVELYVESIKSFKRNIRALFPHVHSVAVVSEIRTLAELLEKYT